MQCARQPGWRRTPEPGGREDAEPDPVQTHRKRTQWEWMKQRGVSSRPRPPDLLFVTCFFPFLFSLSFYLVIGNRLKIKWKWESSSVQILSDAGWQSAGSGAGEAARVRSLSKYPTLNAWAAPAAAPAAAAWRGWDAGTGDIASSTLRKMKHAFYQMPIRMCPIIAFNYRLDLK